MHNFAVTLYSCLFLLYLNVPYPDLKSWTKVNEAVYLSSHSSPWRHRKPCVVSQTSGNLCNQRSSALVVVSCGTSFLRSIVTMKIWSCWEDRCWSQNKNVYRRTPNKVDSQLHCGQNMMHIDSQLLSSVSWQNNLSRPKDSHTENDLREVNARLNNGEEGKWPFNQNIK